MQSVQILEEVPEHVGTGKIVKVRDIYVAAYLMWKHYKFCGADRGNGGYQSAFYFEGVPEDAILAYVNGESEAAGLFNCFKAMRSFSSHVIVKETEAE